MLAKRLKRPKYRYERSFKFDNPITKFIPPTANVNPLQKINK